MEMLGKFVAIMSYRHLRMWYIWNEPSRFIDNMCYMLLWLWLLDFNFMVTGSISGGGVVWTNFLCNNHLDIMIIFHVNLNKMQTLRVPRISV